MAEAIKATFKYGDNALDMVTEYPKPYVISGILAQGEDGENTHISPTPARLYHKNSVKKYGKVVEFVDFGKLTKKKITNNAAGIKLRDTLAAKVKSKAKLWLNSRCKDFGNKVTIKGIDPFYEKKNNTPIAIGDMIKAYSKPHGINEAAPCLAMDIDYFDHQNDQYIIGPYIPNNFYDPKITMR